ncbi:MAG: hypothetical protein WKF84_25685 [Pyrinomonadaceae bacterium]
MTAYTRQGRGGKGRFGATAKGSDFVQHLFIASTHAYIMMFTDNGQVFQVEGSRTAGCSNGGAR